MRFADRIILAWYQGNPFLYLLRPLEILYRYIVSRKRRLFLQGKTDIYRAPVPVIIVGNITVGGTGKTPLIVWMINYCEKKGLKVGVISRGYGAKPPKYPWRVHENQLATVAGDEPLLIVQRTSVPLMIGANRSSSIKALLQEEKIDIILCDDGLQHYKLARDLEILLIDAVRNLGNKRCIPEGPLREPVDRLDSVDAVVYNGLQPHKIINLVTGEVKEITSLKGTRWHAVAGIGNPQRFFDTLTATGCRIIPHVFSDHATYQKKSLLFSPSLPLIMTEKDAVKCNEFACDNWWYLSVNAVPSQSFILWFDEVLVNQLKVLGDTTNQNIIN
ncbi:UNVERIFIED_CONTAM: hypothetical protein GTU68_005048 [Idotea baltica]|nr:hypothetical protein [Idotea baltica]